MRCGQFNQDIAGEKNATSKRYPERPGDKVQTEAEDGSPNRLKGVDNGRLDGVHVSLEKVECEEAEERTSKPE